MKEPMIWNKEMAEAAVSFAKYLKDKTPADTEEIWEEVGGACGMDIIEDCAFDGCGPFTINWDYVYNEWWIWSAQSYHPSDLLDE